MNAFSFTKLEKTPAKYKIIYDKDIGWWEGSDKSLDHLNYSSGLEVYGTSYQKRKESKNGKVEVKHIRL